jgi:predicted small integral membrane protein
VWISNVADPHERVVRLREDRPMGLLPVDDIREARRLFPATAQAAYFNTAVVGLASDMLVAPARAQGL